MKRSNQVCFVVSDELRDALDAEAFALEQTRAGRIRTILAAHLRPAGWLDVGDPLTGQLDRLPVHKPQRESTR